MLFFFVEFKYFNVDFVINIYDFIWVFNVFLSYISDVQQIVYVVKVNECIVISKVFNDIFDFVVFFKVSKKCFVFSVVFCFNNCMMRNNNVVMFSVKFDNFKFKFFVFKVCSIMYWMYVNQ